MLALNTLTSSSLYQTLVAEHLSHVQLGRAARQLKDARGDIVSTRDNDNMTEGEAVRGISGADCKMTEGASRSVGRSPGEQVLSSYARMREM